MLEVRIITSEFGEDTVLPLTVRKQDIEDKAQLFHNFNLQSTWSLLFSSLWIKTSLFREKQRNSKQHCAHTYIHYGGGTHWSVVPNSWLSILG
jgi:hypothetical protein